MGVSGACDREDVCVQEAGEDPHEETQRRNHGAQREAVTGDDRQQICGCVSKLQFFSRAFALSLLPLFSLALVCTVPSKEQITLVHMCALTRVCVCTPRRWVWLIPMKQSTPSVWCWPWWMEEILSSTSTTWALQGSVQRGCSSTQHRSAAVCITCIRKTLSTGQCVICLSSSIRCPSQYDIGPKMSQWATHNTDYIKTQDDFSICTVYILREGAEGRPSLVWV